MIPRREIPLTPAPTWESMIKVLSPLDKNSVKRKKNDMYTITVNVSDYSKEDISVTIDAENRIVVSCDRSYTTQAGIKEHHSIKKTYSLPEDADLQTINAKVNNGILTITIKTKTEKTKGREIEIRW
jgi:hypothetical protein